jgi:hypothetical protein
VNSTRRTSPPPSRQRTENGSALTRYVPAYGTIQSLVGYVAFYLVVRAVRPTFTARFAEHGLDPEFVAFGVSAFVWLVLVLTVVGEGQRQRKANPRRFVSRDEWRSFLEEKTPPSTVFLLYVGGVAFAGILAVRYWARFVRSIEAVLLELTSVPDIPAISPVTIVWIVTIGVALAVFGWCLDRLVIGGARFVQLQLERSGET